MRKSDFTKFFKENTYGPNMKVKVFFKNGDFWNFNCSYHNFRDIRRNITKNLIVEDFKEIAQFEFD